MTSVPALLRPQNTAFYEGGTGLCLGHLGSRGQSGIGPLPSGISIFSLKTEGMEDHLKATEIQESISFLFFQDSLKTPKRSFGI